MTTDPVADPRRVLTPGRIVAGVVVALLLVGFLYWLGWIGGPGAVALDDGAGPAPADVEPPFADARDDTPIRRFELTGDDACGILGTADIEAVYRGSFTSSPTTAGCSYSGVDVQVDVEVMDAPYVDAYGTATEGFGYAEVVYEPFYALFALDAERSVLIVDAGGRSLILRATDASLDRVGHLTRLKRLLARAAD